MASQIALLIDVGSTWTKGLAVSIGEGRLIHRTQHPTTLAQGIMQGVDAVIAELTEQAGEQVVFRAASSSAAGGLRVAALGLVPDLTGVAARQASLGAGARVVFSSGYRIDPSEIDAMRQVRPDIILLSGGTDGGNSSVLLDNAALLAGAKIPASIVLAGNKSVRSHVAAMLTEAGYEVRLADNVLPAIDTLATDSAQQAIREAFLERIVVARGIDELRSWATGGMAPTPKAVLDAAELLSRPPSPFETLVIADIGGATTDIHSVGGSATAPGAVLRGLPEPHIKRTVEGDLGLRVSAQAATDALNLHALAARFGWPGGSLRDEAQRLTADTSLLENTEQFDRIIAIAAVAEAIKRHAGKLESLHFRKKGFAQTGKDLRKATAVIGSGGVFAARADSLELLAEAVALANESDRLVPEEPKLLIDRDYVLFAVGLLAQHHPAAALSLARRSLGL